MTLFEKILASRGLQGSKRDAFLHPSYDAKHDPFLLPDMDMGVERLIAAHKAQEKITIYGDYDIDGLTATTLLLDAFDKFGFRNIETFMPNRFVEGYGLTVDAMDRIATSGTTLIVTVDCGSLSEREITYAKKLGIDVIVTDHHNVAKVQPPAVAVINPKRQYDEYPDEYENYCLKESSEYQGRLYPFVDLAGVGVAFKLVQALQTKLPGLDEGQEKWLLDLVALGTVCDIVSLVDENRANVYWGLKVLGQTKRPGLKALMLVAGIQQEYVNARNLGFGLGPRMNASGRLETAQYSLDLLRANDGTVAYELAQKLDTMNSKRKTEQERIMKEAERQLAQYIDDAVLVVSGKNWNHGIVGIVAAKIVEKYHKPTFVLEEMVDEARGSARSFGDFSVADAIRAASTYVVKGGGHKYAAGVTMKLDDIPRFRKKVNEYYDELQLSSQSLLYRQKPDETAQLSEITEQLVTSFGLLEPFGNANPEPSLWIEDVKIVRIRRMGTEGQHLKISLIDTTEQDDIEVLSFNAPAEWIGLEVGWRVNIQIQPMLNEWRGNRAVEGKLLHIEIREN